MIAKKHGLKVRLRSGEKLAHAVVNAIARRDIIYICRVLNNSPVSCAS